MNKTLTRELECDLTDEEKQKYGKILADKVNEIRAIEDQKKKVMSEYSTKLKSVRLEESRLAIARSSGKELRPVDCVERWNNGVIEVVRLDTNEVVDVHPASIADRQVEFPGLDDDEGTAEDQVARVLQLVPPPPADLTTPSAVPPPRGDAPGWYAGQEPEDSEAAPSASEADAEDVGEVVLSSIGDEVFVGEGMTPEEVAEVEARKEAQEAQRQIEEEKAKPKAKKKSGSKKSGGKKK